MAMVGSFIMLFIGIIVSLSLLVPSAQNVGEVINKKTVVNQSVTFPTNGSTLTLTGQATSGWVIVNASDASKQVSSTNYTVSNYVVSNGVMTSVLTNTLSNPHNPYAGKSVNISYTYEPLGYAPESSTRTIVGLIVLLSTLAILGFVIKQLYDEGYLDWAI